MAGRVHAHGSGHPRGVRRPGQGAGPHPREARRAGTSRRGARSGRAHRRSSRSRMALAVLHSRALSGFDAPPVTVEVHLAGGLPSFTIVGLPDTEVKEARDRVRAALQTSRFEFPARRITVNLAPAELPKEGGGFDLPIALGILAASGQVPGDRLDEFEFVGELSLSGDLRPVRGALAMTYRASRVGPRASCCPRRARTRRRWCATPTSAAPIRCSRSARISPARRRWRATRRRARSHGSTYRRPRRREGPGARQARARDRRGRRALAAADRPAGHRQVDARAAPARPAAADDRRRGARGRGGAVARRRRLRRAALAAAAVPRAAPLGVGGRAGRRRRRRAARRDHARASRRAVPRRAARVPPARARGAARAARVGPRHHLARRAAGRVSRRASSWSPR